MAIGGSVFERNRGLGKMTSEYLAERGKKVFGIGVFAFGHGLIWFRASSSGGILTLQTLSLSNAFSRAELVIGAVVVVYGILLWRSASHKLSRANYIVAFSCMFILILAASKILEWAYFVRQQSVSSILDFRAHLGLTTIEIALVFCIVLFGGWWADSTYMQDRLRRLVRSSRSVR
jgi:amino acid permease